MSLYVHLPFAATAAQEKNLILLARHLIMHGDALNASGAFEVNETFRIDSGTETAELSPEAAATHPDTLIIGALGCGPRAGVTALADEDWYAYAFRAFGISNDETVHDWFFGFGWRRTDPSPRGAALRMMYALDYGIPQDWYEIMEGRRDSDYDRNNFLFDRMDLMDPRHEAKS